MALETYRAKRDFSATSEPKGGRGRTAGASFVVQKHAARRLHYDLRLEMEGVLRSWAVTRGPSLDPSEKRLAVLVEDHPLEYGDFEGTIPKGEYGGGTVIVWDRGRWAPVGDLAKGYAKGHLEFSLEGEKLRGNWHLVRMQGKPGEKRENWLLIKSEDDFARLAKGADILDERPESVKTGRTIEEVAQEKPERSMRSGTITTDAAKKGRQKRVSKPETESDLSPVDLTSLKGAKKASLPDFVEPMLASHLAAAPKGNNWLHEIKFDGYRLQARIEAGRVKLLTRSGLDWTKKFGTQISAALQNLPVGTAILDGELVSEAGGNASDFSALQTDLSEGRTDRFVYYVFDLLHLDGHDLKGLPLVERKTILENLLRSDPGQIRYSGHFEESGDLVLRHACRLSLEGIISKLRDGRYKPGRGRGWVKSKCSSRQEFVIGGYVPSTVSRKAIGSLVLGVYEGGSLHHVGRVGTGFSTVVSEDLFQRFQRLRQPSTPFADKLTSDEARKVIYLRPELVAEIEFRSWTGDGHLRHASFRGLREDKLAKDVVREMPKTGGKASAPPKVTFKLTHPDRIYWPDDGVTKAGLADYYAEVWRVIAPHIVGRPLALLRCPTGISGEQFFQKHAWKGLNRSIALIQDPKDTPDTPLISINDLDGLIGLVQASVLEIHPWSVTIEDWEKPDRIIMDLDPGEGVAWERVLKAAEDVRQLLQLAGLSSFVKTSGGKGLHVVAPLKPQAEWPAVKAFCKSFADAMASDEPDKYVSTITKSKRDGKILIDYLRNQRGATAVAAYSTRARPGAAVSAPLSWDEIGPAIGPAYFTVETMPTRLDALTRDPWDGFREAAIPLETSGRSRRKKTG